MFFFKSQNKCTVTHCDKCLEGKVHSGKRAHVGVGQGPNFLEVRKGFPEELTFELKYEAKKILNSLTAGLPRGFKELKCSGNSHKEATAFPFSILRVALILGSFCLEHVVGLMPHSPRGTVSAQPSHLCRAQPSPFLLLCG